MMPKYSIRKLIEDAVTENPEWERFCRLILIISMTPTQAICVNNQKELQNIRDKLKKEEDIEFGGLAIKTFYTLAADFIPTTDYEEIKDAIKNVKELGTVSIDRMQEFDELGIIHSNIRDLIVNSLRDSAIIEKATKGMSKKESAEDYEDLYPTDIDARREFEQKIRNERKGKLQKTIETKEKNIQKAQDNLNAWLDSIASDENINLVKVEAIRKREQAKINKRREEVALLKKTLSSI